MANNNIWSKLKKAFSKQTASNLKKDSGKTSTKKKTTTKSKTSTETNTTRNAYKSAYELQQNKIQQAFKADQQEKLKKSAETSSQRKEQRTTQKNNAIKNDVKASFNKSNQQKKKTQNSSQSAQARNKAWEKSVEKEREKVLGNKYKVQKEWDSEAKKLAKSQGYSSVGQARKQGSKEMTALDIKYGQKKNDVLYSGLKGTASGLSAGLTDLSKYAVAPEIRSALEEAEANQTQAGKRAETLSNIGASFVGIGATAGLSKKVGEATLKGAGSMFGRDLSEEAVVSRLAPILEKKAAKLSAKKGVEITGKDLAKSMFAEYAQDIGMNVGGWGQALAISYAVKAKENGESGTMAYAKAQALNILMGVPVNNFVAGRGAINEARVASKADKIRNPDYNLYATKNEEQGFGLPQGKAKTSKYLAHTDEDVEYKLKNKQDWQLSNIDENIRYKGRQLAYKSKEYEDTFNKIKELEKSGGNDDEIKQLREELTKIEKKYSTNALREFNKAVKNAKASYDEEAKNIDFYVETKFSDGTTSSTKLANRADAEAHAKDVSGLGYESKVVEKPKTNAELPTVEGNSKQTKKTNASKKIVNKTTQGLSTTDSEKKMLVEDVDDTVAEVKRLISEGKTKEAAKLAQDNANKMASSLKVSVESADDDIRKFIKAQNFVIGDEAADLTYSEGFRKKWQGKIKIKRGKSNVDEIYQLLNKNWGEMFPLEKGEMKDNNSALMSKILEVYEDLEGRRVNLPADEEKSIADKLADDIFNLAHEGNEHKTISEVLDDTPNNYFLDDGVDALTKEEQAELDQAVAEYNRLDDARLANRGDFKKSAEAKLDNAEVRRSGQNEYHGENTGASKAEKKEVEQYYQDNITRETRIGHGSVNAYNNAENEAFRQGIKKDMEDGGYTFAVAHDEQMLRKSIDNVVYTCLNEDGTLNTQSIKAFVDKAKDFNIGVRDIAVGDASKYASFESYAAMSFANKHYAQDPKLMSDLFAAYAGQYTKIANASGVSLRLGKMIAGASPESRKKALQSCLRDYLNNSSAFINGTIFGGFKNGHAKMDEQGFETFLKDEMPEVNALFDKLGTTHDADEAEKVISDIFLESNKKIPMSALDMLTEWRYISMLCSPKTHIRNIVGNSIFGSVRQFSDALAASKQIKYYKEGKIQYVTKGGLSKEATVESHMRADKLEEKGSEIGKLAKKSYDEAKEALFKAAQKYEYYRTGGGTKIADTLNKWSDFISGWLEKEDGWAVEWRYRENYHKFLNANKYGTAEQTVKDTAELLKLADEYSRKEALEATFREYNSAAQAINILSRSMAKADSSLGKRALALGVNAVMPFVKTPLNVLKQSAINYNPITLFKSHNELNKALSHSFEELKNGKEIVFKNSLLRRSGGVDSTYQVVTHQKGGKTFTQNLSLEEAEKYFNDTVTREINEACEKIGKGKTGGAILGIGAVLGMLDTDAVNFRTNAGNDAAEKHRKDQGFQNYSVNFGNKFSATLDWATPVSAMLFTGVEFGKQIKEILSADGYEVGEAMNIAAVVASRMLDPTLEMSMLSGINNALESIKYSNKYDEGDKVSGVAKILSNVVSNYVSSTIPSVLSQVSRSLAPNDYWITGDNDFQYFLNSNISKIPVLSNVVMPAKTDSWGRITGDKSEGGERVLNTGLSLFNNMFPSNVKKISWDKTDDALVKLYKKTDDKDIFPKVNYLNDGIAVGRDSKGLSKTELKLTPKEKSLYNQQRNVGGEDAMKEALESIIFNREGSALTKEQKQEYIDKYKGKSTKEVIKWVISTDEYKNASNPEKTKIMRTIFDNAGDEAKGNRRTSERAVWESKGKSVDKYDFKNELSAKQQSLLTQAVDDGVVTYKEAVDFCRNAGKTHYYETEDGGMSRTTFGQKTMIPYLISKGYSYEKAEALYNAFKMPNAKSYSGNSSGSGSGSSKKSTTKIDTSAYKTKKFTPKSSSKTTSKGYTLEVKSNYDSKKKAPPTLEKFKI